MSPMLTCECVVDKNGKRYHLPDVTMEMKSVILSDSHNQVIRK